MAGRRGRPPKKDGQQWDQNTVSDFMFEQFNALTVEGNDVYRIQNSVVAAISDVGLRLPHLSLRVLFQRATLPMERTIIVFGPPKSNKSAFVYYFYDLFAQNGGKYLHLESEDKDTPEFRLSLTGYDSKAGWVRRCESLTDLMTGTKLLFDKYCERCQSAGGPGKRAPLVIGVDSLTAKLTDEAAGVMDSNDGAPGRRFADEARALADWFRYIPGKLQGWPVCLFAVNHDKPKPGQHPGQVQHHAPGGVAPNYYATYVILAQKIGSVKQNAEGWEGNRIKFRMERSALGSEGNTIEAELMWCVSKGVSRSGKASAFQETYWNWDKATTELLYSIAENKEKYGRRGRMVKELLGITKVTGGRYAASGLGISTKDPLPPREFAQELEKRDDLLKDLEPYLGIIKSTPYKPGQDFDEQLAEAANALDDFLPQFGDDGRIVMAASDSIDTGATQTDDGEEQNHEPEV